jgi:hypothetical protein
MRPSQEMKNTAPTYPGKEALFWLGVDRFAFHGHDAYTMDYPGKDIPPCWTAYRTGVRSCEFGWDYRRKLREL